MPVPVPPARPVLRAASAGSGTPVTPARVKPLPFGTADNVCITCGAIWRGPCPARTVTGRTVGYTLWLDSFVMPFEPFLGIYTTGKFSVSVMSQLHVPVLVSPFRRAQLIPRHE